MKNRDVNNFFNRIIAAIETPDDLNNDERKDLINDIESFQKEMFAATLSEEN